MRHTFILGSLFILLSFHLQAQQSGYDLWLRYYDIGKPEMFRELSRISLIGDEMDVIRHELDQGYSGMMDFHPEFQTTVIPDSDVLISLKNTLPAHLGPLLESSLENAGEEGYVIRSTDGPIVISANSHAGLLYGTFAFLRHLQIHGSVEGIDTIASPKINIRILNHWDNLDRTVERGYAGESLWNWHKLPEYKDPRYTDYARANASIGINATVLTNVNANALILTPQYLEKVAALADIFRPYGIKVYLTARFSAPIELGDLDTADPLDKRVGEWWKRKAAEIYSYVPDFGGFLVKANSEGQPGPQDYDRNHAEGANMLAAAVGPHGGVVMWRAFVYSAENTIDRAGQAYDEFMPLDGKFADNVLIQVKNGPIDFQPREPFSPVFGAMKKTPLMMEFQITQEYLGFSTHLVFLPKLFKEVLDANTYQYASDATVADIVAGTHSSAPTGMAGVANIGSDMNWTGHLFGQANWYGFGRLAWNPDISPEQIAREWLSMTFTSDEKFVEPMTELLIQSRESAVKYMTPLGLHHIMDAGHHYGPGPWISNMSRPDWTSVYYHKADSLGVGFDRTEATGSGTLGQYAEQIQEQYSDPERIPEEYLLWFHHLPWEYQMKNGRTLWDNLGIKYQEGVDEVQQMIKTWELMRTYVSEEDFRHVQMMLSIQLKEAVWWKDACMLYFQQFSRLDFPAEMTPPEKPLSWYQSLKFPYAPGIRPRW